MKIMRLDSTGNGGGSMVMGERQSEIYVIRGQKGQEKRVKGKDEKC